MRNSRVALRIRNQLGVNGYIQYKAHESLKKCKARLVVRGHMETHEDDYQETFTLIPKMNTMRVLLSLVANFG